MSADPRPSLSESMKAALLADPAVQRAMTWLIGNDGDRFAVLELMAKVCAAYSAYLARTPLGDLLLEIAPADVEAAAASDPRRDMLPAGTSMGTMAAVARDILTLRTFAASLQERIAALEGGASMLDRIDDHNIAVIERLGTQVAALTAERNSLLDELHMETDAIFDLETCRLTAEVARLRAENAALTADRDRLDWLADAAIHPLELDRMGGVEGDPPVGPMFLTFNMSGERDKYAAPTLREVIDATRAQWDAARTPPVPEEPTNG